MRVIPLDTVANQSLTVTIDQRRWSLTIKQARSSMIADVSLDDVPLLQGMRFCVGTPLIPFRYLQGAGNFLLLVDGEDLPDWRKFGTSQRLVYVAPGEVDYSVPIEWPPLSIFVPPPFTGPLLDLNFTTNRYFSGAPKPTQKLFSDIITYTRAGDAGRFNSAGLFELVGPNVPRFDYDPVTRQPRGLLIEEARTNLLLRSSELNDAYWTKTRLSVTPDAATASFGELVDQLVEDSTAANTHLVIRSVSYTSGTTYTRSVVAKDSGRDIRLNFPAAAFGALAGCNFNLALGLAGTPSAGVTAKIESWGGGYYRCSITATATATTAGNDECRLVNRSTGATIYDGDGVSGVYIWGTQLEAGASPSSHIPTGASTVTRAVDVASVNTLSPWYNALEGALFAEWASSSALVPTGNREYIAAFSDSSISNSMALTRNDSEVIQGVSQVGGVVQPNLNWSSTANTDVHRAAMAFDGVDKVMSVDGGSPVTAAQPNGMPTVTELHLGIREDGSRSLNGHIRTFRYWPRRDMPIQELTA